MELLESFLFSLDDQFLGNSNKRIAGDTAMYSVNSAYITDKFGNVNKASGASDYQDRLRNIILYSRKTKGIYKCPIFLNVEVHKLLSRKKDGEDDKRGHIDIDNVLKGNIDCLNKTVFNDDEQIGGMIVKIFYNREGEKHSYIKIKVFRYEEWEFDSFKEGWNDRNKERLIYKNGIVLPKGMHIISYNEMYDRTYKNTKLTPNAKKYKEYLDKAHSEAFGKKDLFEGIAVADYTFFAKAGDLDNKVKAFQDTLTKTILKDDKQIQTLFLQRKTIAPDVREGVKVSIYSKE